MQNEARSAEKSPAGIDSLEQLTDEIASRQAHIYRAYPTSLHTHNIHRHMHTYDIKMTLGYPTSSITSNGLN